MIELTDKSIGFVFVLFLKKPSTEVWKRSMALSSNIRVGGSLQCHLLQRIWEVVALLRIALLFN